MSKIIVGTNNDDTLVGTNGDDIFFGLGGRDLMAGGKGNDTYVVENPLDIVFELGNQGTDTVYSTVALSKAFANVENYIFTTNASVVFNGNELNNVIQTGAGDDLINGGQGADTMYGAQGNDIYYVDNALDVVKENADQGNDTAYSSVSYALGANVESLLLTGKGNINGTGNSLTNVIAGNSGNNVLDGGIGDSDILIGGAGNDTYVLHNAGDMVVESIANANGGGVDTIITSFSYSLANLANVENLTIVGGPNGTSLIGNALNNTLTGDAGSNILDGGAGVDWMAGGKGSDTYYVDAATDVAFEWAGEGMDTVISTVAIAGAYLNVENYVFKTSEDVHLTTFGDDNNIQGGSGNDVINAGNGTNVVYGNAGDDGLVGGANHDLLYGGAGNDWLQGGDGMDTLDGGTGADLMAGGAGGDTYFVDSAGDQVIEGVNGPEGDTVCSTVSITKLWDNIETVYLQGNSDLDVVGNALGNALFGNDGANIIDGGAGIDLMAGGKGNDTYHVDNGQDMVDEKVGEGIDTVVTSLNWYKLDAALENLTFDGSGNFEGHGNQHDNVITGGAGNDFLDGAFGSDTLIGGKGDDTYVVDAFGLSGDHVIETVANADGGGHDTIQAWGSFSLEALTNVEDLWLLGPSASQGIGNDLDNTIYGNDADNVLEGGAGADFMVGGAGNDIYVVDNLGDQTNENNADSGIDTVYSAVALDFAANNVENYYFSTNADLHFYANGASNEIHGGSGNDTIDGAGGFDRLSGEAGNDCLMGGDQSDVLDGGSGADTLIGGSGGDFLAGGSGQDRFVFDMSGGGDGNDSVIDFLKAEDILDFSNVGDHDKDGKVSLGDLLLSVSGVVDHGAGHAVDVAFDNGSMITFQGCGTGAVSAITDLVANAATQIQVH